MPHRAQQQVVTDGDMSTASFYSLASNAGSLLYPSYQVSWTGTPTGVITVEVSNNYDRIRDTGNWDTLTLETAISQPAGGASNVLIDLTWLPFQFVRLKYTRTAGSGTMQAHYFAKGAA